MSVGLDTVRCVRGPRDCSLAALTLHLLQQSVGTLRRVRAPSVKTGLSKCVSHTASQRLIVGSTSTTLFSRAVSFGRQRASHRL